MAKRRKNALGFMQGANAMSFWNWFARFSLQELAEVGITICDFKTGNGAEWAIVKTPTFRASFYAAASVSGAFQKYTLNSPAEYESLVELEDIGRRLSAVQKDVPVTRSKDVGDVILEGVAEIKNKIGCPVTAYLPLLPRHTGSKSSPPIFPQTVKCIVIPKRRVHSVPDLIGELGVELGALPVSLLGL